MTQLSVIVIVVGDTVTPFCGTDELRECIASLGKQINSPSMEIIVPHHAGIRGIELLQDQYPGVVFIDAEHLGFRSRKGWSREHHDELRTRGVLAARGEIIAFLEDHTRPAEDWSSCVMSAHSNFPFAGIGGAIENGTNRLLNWAVYFCDLGRYQNPLEMAESPFASIVNISYKRSSLNKIHEVWEQKFDETAVNSTLIARGEKIALSPDIVVYTHRQNLSLGIALKEFFIWGRSYARNRSISLKWTKRLFLVAFSVFLPFLMLWRMIRRVGQKKRNVREFIKTTPVLLSETISWSLGEMFGYIFS